METTITIREYHQRRRDTYLQDNTLLHRYMTHQDFIYPNKHSVRTVNLFTTHSHCYMRLTLTAHIYLKILLWFLFNAFIAYKSVGDKVLNGETQTRLVLKAAT